MGMSAQGQQATKAQGSRQDLALDSRKAQYMSQTITYQQSDAAHETLRITKSNALIEANYRLSLMETRLLLLCIGRINSRLPLDEQRVFKVQAAEFQTRYGVSQAKSYQCLKEIADRLFERKVEIHEPVTGVVNDKIRWVSRCKYLAGQGAVQLHFAPEILPYISDIKAHFTSYPLVAVSGFSSTFAIRLYEVLGQYRELGKRTVSLEDLRRWLDCTETFQKFNDLDRWVIKISVDQINKHSDLRITYKKVKQGRSVSHIEFVVKRAEQKALIKKAAPSARRSVKAIEESPDEAVRAWRAQMAKYGFDPDQHQPLPLKPAKVSIAGD